MISRKEKPRMIKPSTQARTEGKLHEVKGTIKEKVGKATNHPDLENAGNAEKKAGRVQKWIGRAEKAVGEIRKYPVRQTRPAHTWCWSKRLNTMRICTDSWA